MNIDANELTLGQLLLNQEFYYEIPLYQRNYSWGISQWEDFWNDFNELEDAEEHFFGSIVVINKTANQAGYNCSQVVDGQQRLVTISLLINAIKNKMESIANPPQNYDKPYWKEIEDSYLYTKKPGLDKKEKLLLGNLDKDSYKNILSKDFNNIDNKLIINAYNYFYNQFNELNEDIIKGILNKLLHNIKIVLIATDSEKTAFRLFETLNDRGLDLSSVDLIKNKVLSIVARDKTSETKQNFLKIVDWWDETINNLEDIDKVRFFRHYLMSSKIAPVKTKVTKEKLYDEFTKKIIIMPLEQLNIYIKDIQECSDIYSQINNSNCVIFQNNKNINNLLSNLSAIKASTSYTLLLRAFKELNNSEKYEDIINILKYVEIFAIRRIITNKSTAELDSIYNKLAINAFKQDNYLDIIKREFINNMPSDDEFIQNFKTRIFQSNNQLKYILDTIEEKYYSPGGKEVKDREAVHIEHIMPQTWKTKVYSSWKDYLGIDEETFYAHRNLIGNLTLLEKKPNIEASNNPFEEKKKFYSPKKTEIRMTQKIIEYKEWKIEQILQRSEELAKIAVEIWNLK